MTNYEKETIINYNEAEERAIVYTFNGAMKRKLAAFAAAYPDKCELIRKDKTGAVTYEIDKDRLSVNFRRPMTKEESAKLRERALKNNLAERMRAKRDFN